jgi:hypothetical protein
MTPASTPSTAPSTAPSSPQATGSAGRACERRRLSGWVLARLVLLLAAQIAMLTALMTDHTGPADTVAGTTTRQARMTHVAYTQPLAPTGVGAPASRSGNSMTCAGRSVARGPAGPTGASATGFNLNVVVGRGGQSGAGPLVVTCGEQGQLMILACSPLTGDAGRTPAIWDCHSAGGAGWAPAGWDQPGWRNVWRRDWRSQGLGDDQLDLLSQLDPDQLRALLAQRYPSHYQGSGYHGGYDNGYGSGPVAGASLGGMQISIGAPTSLHQLPLGPADPYLNPYSDPYGNLYASGEGAPWSSAWGSGASSSWNPALGYGAGYGPSSLDGPGYLDDPGSPTLISSHHHDSDHDRDDDPDEDRGRDSARGEWGAGGASQPVAVCRWIGQR